MTLEALADGQARTAGEIANLTGPPAHTVNNKLTQLKKQNRITKAAHGYAVPPGIAATTQ